MRCRHVWTGVPASRPRPAGSQWSAAAGPGAQDACQRASRTVERDDLGVLEARIVGAVDRQRNAPGAHRAAFDGADPAADRPPLGTFFACLRARGCRFAHRCVDVRCAHALLCAGRRRAQRRKGSAASGNDDGACEKKSGHGVILWLAADDGHPIGPVAGTLRLHARLIGQRARHCADAHRPHAAQGADKSHRSDLCSPGPIAQKMIKRHARWQPAAVTGWHAPVAACASPIVGGLHPAHERPE